MIEVKRVTDRRNEDMEEFDRVVNNQDGSYAEEMDAVFVGGRFNGIEMPHILLMNLAVITGFTPRWSAMKNHNPKVVNKSLEDQPIIEGYLSPMLDGGKLRYETQEIYDKMFS